MKIKLVFIITALSLFSISAEDYNSSSGLAAKIQEKNRQILSAKNPDMLKDSINKIDEFNNKFVYVEQEDKQLKSNLYKERLSKIKEKLSQMNSNVKASTYRYKSDTQAEYEARLLTTNEKMQKYYIKLKEEEKILEEKIKTAERKESQQTNMVFDEKNERIRQRLEYINSQRNRGN